MGGSTDGLRQYYAKWNKPAGERQVLLDFTHMWNLKDKINWWTKEIQGHWSVEQADDSQREGGGRWVAGKGWTKDLICMYAEPMDTGNSVVAARVYLFMLFHKFHYIKILHRRYEHLSRLFNCELRQRFRHSPKWSNAFIRLRNNIKSMHLCMLLATSIWKGLGVLLERGLHCLNLLQSLGQC